MSQPPLHVTFVCTGNICRSPMGEQMLRSRLVAEAFAESVRVTSAGTTKWEVGNRIDERAGATLRQHGYPSFAEHVAKFVTAEHLGADLILALDQSHHQALVERGAPQQNVRLLRGFDPDADGTEVADPYYGSVKGFETTYAQIEAALPGIVAWCASRLN